jgi:ADP-dependent NAD(P)H-hydrate dehydratase / NAD(P)H-hydrate epimerase
MLAAEKGAFARGVSAEALMDEAGAGIARAVQQFFPAPGRCLVFAGKGNNGGDTLVAAAHLKRAGWNTDLHLTYSESECSELLRKKIADFRSNGGASSASPRASNPGVAELRPPIILDGLLGLGSKPPLRGPILKSAREINRLRREQNAYVFAIDLPSGLDSDTGQIDADCVAADFTVTISNAKRGLLADDAIDFVGRLEVVPLPELLLADGDETVACGASLNGLLPRRAFDAYKNQFGRVGIVAGSRGFAGAASMCAWGALRGGAGLVEVFVPQNIYEVVASAAPFEAMVKPVRNYADLLDEKIDVWAIGPGIGAQPSRLRGRRASRLTKTKSTKAHDLTPVVDSILHLIQQSEQPMVIDADALNILSNKIAILEKCKGPRLLTPHPGEMKRLAGDEKLTRAETAQKFTRQFPVTLLLKGSRTIVAEGRKRLSYNSTGNPGMATGGMGDILTGVCAALIAQKLSPFDAARLGTWMCGRAAEIARFNHEASEQSLLPRDVLDHLGAAANELSLSPKR